jgi:hypothetical protein
MQATVLESLVAARSAGRPVVLATPLSGAPQRLLDLPALDALSAAEPELAAAARLALGDRRPARGRRRAGGRGRGSHRHALMSPLVARSRASTGRVNLFAESAGLFTAWMPALIDRLNQVDESVTIATLPNRSVVAPKEMLATIKVIPFAVPGMVLAVMEALAKGRAAFVHPFRQLKRRPGADRTARHQGKRDGGRGGGDRRARRGADGHHAAGGARAARGRPGRRCADQAAQGGRRPAADRRRLRRGGPARHRPGCHRARGRRDRAFRHAGGSRAT